MIAGLQTFRSDGSIEIDITTGLPKILGVANQERASSGQLVIPAFRRARGFFYPYSMSFSAMQYLPTIRIEGDRLIWSNLAAFSPPLIVYGIY